jgi:hypothetical protein
MGMSRGSGQDILDDPLGEFSRPLVFLQHDTKPHPEFYQLVKTMTNSLPRIGGRQVKFFLSEKPVQGNLSGIPVVFTATQGLGYGAPGNCGSQDTLEIKIFSDIGVEKEIHFLG